MSTLKIIAIYEYETGVVIKDLIDKPDATADIVDHSVLGVCSMDLGSTSTNTVMINFKTNKDPIAVDLSAPIEVAPNVYMSPVISFYDKLGVEGIISTNVEFFNKMRDVLGAINPALNIP